MHFIATFRVSMCICLRALLRSTWRIRDLSNWWKNTTQYWYKSYSWSPSRIIWNMYFKQIPQPAAAVEVHPNLFIGNIKAVKNLDYLKVRRRKLCFWQSILDNHNHQHHHCQHHRSSSSSSSQSLSPSTWTIRALGSPASWTCIDDNDYH